ncbi:ataxin-7-like protein 2a isoform X1 [Boleophthalmus pectinirostris]|uniref:ataxin-7-like protein 2a isoform X1 n=2 Tax=Boleophthalmus pectinirostris TaxID=150288 RepID=UPI000A1C7105|nr:ataxin-7-like protein 2a isoform X1 [Boleophthalmus pectinirostris]
MMAVRERAVKVMAALVRRVPSLDDFVGESWSSWAEWAGITAADGIGVDDFNKNDKKAAEAMPLSKEDMSIFGLFPGHDDFFLVVCNHCGQVVKPQAFEKHCERRHGPLAKLYAKLRTVNPASQPSRPLHNHSPSHATPTLPVSSWENRNQTSGPARNTPPSHNTPSPATPPQYRHSKSPKDATRHSPLEKSSYNSHSEPKIFKAPPILEPQMSSPPASLRDPPWPHGGGPPIRPTPSDRPPTPKKDALLSSSVPAHRIPRAYNKVASKRECDLDKHCGVLDPDRKKVCTRLLTCNIHSIHQRRKVLGRSKNFDQLVAELKTKAREKGFQNVEGGLCVKRSPSPEAPKDQAGSPHCRRPLTNHPAFSHPPVSSEKPTEVEETQEEAIPRPPTPEVTGGVSSDDSEGESPEEPAEYHFSAAHPRPLAVCSFGSRAVGHGIFTFDRRLHHLRSALSNMIEQHISAHLWKKIPQVTDLQSAPSSTKTSSSSSLHSKVRTGSHIGSSLKTPSCTPLSSHGTKLTPSHSSSSGFNSGGADVNSAVKHIGTKNAMKRPNKQMLKLREEVANAAALRKRKAPSQDGEHSGPNRNCTPLQDRYPPSTHTAPFCSPSSLPSALPHGQTNGTQSPSSKPRPHLPPTDSQWTNRRTHPSPISSPPSSTLNNNSQRRGATGDSGSHSQATARSLDHSLLKKRKGGSTEERLPTSKSPVPQHRLPAATPVPSTPPRSSFYTMKDGKTGALSRGMDKKLATQKPKLHH